MTRYRIIIKAGRYTDLEVRLEQHLWWCFWVGVGRYGSDEFKINKLVPQLVEMYGISSDDVIDQTV